MITLSVPAGRKVPLPGRGTTFVREIEGPPGAPTLMLLHGLGATAAVNWPGAFDALRPHFRVVALDHRGHGQGMRSARPFQIEDCADDVVALADVLGLDQVIPVGYSMGGPITLSLAYRHPDRVRAMVLCATSAHFTGVDPAQLAMFDAVAMGLRLTPSPLGAHLTEWLARSVGSGQASPTLMEEIVRHDPAAIVEATNTIRRFDARGWIGRLRAPAAVVVTTTDRRVDPARQVELAQLTGASVHRVQADHEVALRRPQAFLPVLVEACLSVAGRGHPGALMPPAKD
jgi:3-oxoadipate enol-lactonase